MGHYPYYPNRLPSTAAEEVTGDRIRAVTQGGRTSVSDMDALFDTLADQHEAALASVEGGVAEGLVVSPYESEHTRLRLGAILNLGQVDVFADAVDFFNVAIDDLNLRWSEEQVAQGWEWQEREQAQAASENRPPRPLPDALVVHRSEATDAMDRDYERLWSEIDEKAGEIGTMIGQEPTDGAVGQLVGAGVIPPDDLDLILEEFHVRSEDVVDWFKVQLEAGNITSLDDVPEGLDDYNDALLRDPTIRASMPQWLPLDAEFGEHDGELIVSGDIGSPAWSLMQRRLTWATALPVDPLLAEDRGPDVRFTGGQRNYLGNVIDVAATGDLPVPTAAYGLEELNHRLDHTNEAFRTAFADALVALSVDGSEDSLPGTVIEAAESGEPRVAADREDPQPPDEPASHDALEDLLAESSILIDGDSVFGGVADVEPNGYA